MRAIITRPNNGIYDEVGMNNRFMTSDYKTENGLIKYGIPKYFRGKLRIEIYTSLHMSKPVKTLYIER